MLSHYVQLNISTHRTDFAFDTRNKSCVKNLQILWSPMLSLEDFIHYCLYIRGGTDKSLARPGRKQATANKLGIYSTYSPRSSIHFLARFSNLCKPLKKKSEGCPSNQVSAAAMTSTSEEKWPFNCFFQSKEQVVVRRGQIQRIGWVIKTLEAQLGQFLLDCKCLVSRGIVVEEQDPLGDLTAAFLLQNVHQLRQQRWVILRVDSLALWKIIN